MKNLKKLFLFLMHLGVLLEIFLLRGEVDLAVLLLILYWFIISISFRFSPKVSYITALLWLFLGMVFSFKQNQFFPISYAENFSKWGYFFLFLGLVEEIFTPL